MPDVAGFREKVIQVCDLNRALGRHAPGNRSALTTWLGLGTGTLSGRYQKPVAHLTLSLERAIVMALGFGPAEPEFVKDPDRAWSSWQKNWGELWRVRAPEDLVKKLDEEGYFAARAPDDARLLALLPKIRRKKDGGGAPIDLAHTEPAAISLKSVSRAEGGYLDRLASLEVVCIRKESKVYDLLATCTFGSVEVCTPDATYMVSINRCRAEVLLREAAFEPRLQNEVVESRSAPIRKISIIREASRLNHPSWRLDDIRHMTPLFGEYCNLELGSVRGEIDEDDEASLLIYKNGFAVSAISGAKLEQGGILTNLLRYLVTEHVGEIEQHGSYIYHLSAGPILLRGHDD